MCLFFEDAVELLDTPESTGKCDFGASALRMGQPIASLGQAQFLKIIMHRVTSGGFECARKMSGGDMDGLRDSSQGHMFLGMCLEKFLCPFNERLRWPRFQAQGLQIHDLICK